MITAIMVLGSAGVLFGLVLSYAAERFHVEGNPVVDKIEALLPQTQCGQCGLTGCRTYAEAIAKEDTDIDLCAPGGDITVRALADLLDIDISAKNDSQMEQPEESVVVIDEQNCIGCTLCIQVCPVDAIVGAAKLMHTVIAAECTGCNLCVQPCPVTCIHVTPITKTLQNWHYPLPITSQGFL